MRGIVLKYFIVIIVYSFLYENIKCDIKTILPRLRTTTAII